MMNGTFRTAALVVAALACFPAGTSAQTASAPALAGDAPALAAYRAMHTAFRNARTLAYESEYVWETEGREIGRSSYRAWLKKPNYARIESRSGDGTRTGTLVLDGREEWIFWPSGRPHMYASDSAANARDAARTYLRKDASKGTHSIARETSLLGTGMSMTILDPSVFLKSPDVMDALLEGVRSAGSGNLDGEVCDIVEASYSHGDRIRVFWISRRDHLPRRLEETVRVKREIVVREDWRAISVNAKMSNDVFRWTPPAGWTEYRLPELTDGLLGPGTVAPDFDLSLLGGGRFKLSEHRGSVIWLSFWRISCVPCRAELGELQKLEKKYRASGLVVIPFNSSDDPALIRAFLAQREISLPSVADTSSAAREIFSKKYQVASGSAMPLNYVIDREGRVADAWYGYRKGDARGERTLRKLGVAD